MNERFRILSIDGGGLRGAYAASYLARLEELTGHRVRDCFDLIAGTSTGGIIAIACGLGIPAETIKRLYLDEGPRIFPRKPFGKARMAWGAKHDAAPLHHALQEVFGERTLGESTTRLCIPATTGTTASPRVFKTSHHETFRIDHAIPAWKVAAATSSAPLYLPGMQADAADPLVDGGLWANNPALVAVFEAVAYLHRDWSEISILSLGTGTMGGIPRDEVLRPRWMSWLPGIFDVAIGSQSKSASFLLDILVREKGLRYRRDEPSLNGRTPLDDPSCLEKFTGVGDEHARLALAEVEKEFFYGARRPFQPIHGGKAT